MIADFFFFYLFLFLQTQVLLLRWTMRAFQESLTREPFLLSSSFKKKKKIEEGSLEFCM